MDAARGLYWVRIGDVALTVQGAREVGAREWNEYVDFAAREAPNCRVCLIVSDGGGPNARQRRQINSVPGVSALPTAVVSPSFLVRSIVGAMTLGGRAIRAFSPFEVGLACSYLGIDGVTRREVLAAVAELRAKVASGRSAH